MQPVHLYSVVLKYRGGGVISEQVVATSQREAVKRVRERYEFTRRDGSIAKTTLHYCDRIQNVDGYEIMLRRKVEEASK